MLLLEALLVARPQLLNRRQVHLVERVSSACVDCASTSRCAMRARKPVMGTRCSARLPLRARQAAVACRGAGCRRCRRAQVPSASAGAGRRRASCRGSPTTSDLVSRPSRPEAGIAGRIELVLLDQAANRGTQLPGSRLPWPPLGGRARSRVSLAAPRRRAAAVAAAEAAAAASARLHRMAPRALLDDRQHLPARHDRAALHPDLAHHAVCRRRHLEHDLVGLEVGEILIARMASPGLLVPGHERRIGDRLGQLRNADFGAHELFLMGQRRRRLSGAAWPARRTSAGEAAWSRARNPRWRSRAAPRRRAPAARARGSCAMPVAGAAAGARPAYSTCAAAPASSCRRWRIWYQAPWFCGSS